jgi:hypothetical protein
MDDGLVATPADVVAKATKTLRRVMSLQIVWFLCFVTGGALAVWTAWKNSNLPAACAAVASQGRASTSVIQLYLADCAHRSYLWPVILLVVGVVGLVVTGYVATRLAFKYLGAGAAAFLRQSRRRTGPPRGGQNTGGGFPADPAGMPPGFDGGLPPGFIGGLPPGVPGSPTGPPVG